MLNAQLSSIAEVIAACLYWWSSIDYSRWTMAYLDNGRGSIGDGDIYRSAYSSDQGCKSTLSGHEGADKAGHNRHHITLALLPHFTTDTDHMSHVDDDPILPTAIIATSWIAPSLPQLHSCPA